MKRWKIALSIGIGAVVVSVIVLFYSIPINTCTLFPSRTSSDLMAPVSPKELYDSSELVVIGRITDSAAKCEGSQIWTHMQIEVEDSAKNPQGIKVLTGKAIGGKIGNYGYWAEDSPIFNKGDRAFLYLYKNSSSETVYTISQYSGVLNDPPDERISAKEILKTYRLQLIENDNSSNIDIQRASSKAITFSLESFFGYSSPTNLTISSFTYYDINRPEPFNTANVTVLREFGLSIEPTYAVITPPANGTGQATFLIGVSETAPLGVYDILLSSAVEDRYSYLAGGVVETFVRFNVTDQHGGNISPSSSANNSTVIISKGIDVIDSGVTFNPPFVRTIIGLNNTVTWINKNDTSVDLESPYGGSLFRNVTILPNDSFSFAFNQTGVYYYYEKNAGKEGIVVVSTEELESSRLPLASPSILQDRTEDLQDIARTIIQAVDKEDDVASIRLNNTRMVAYTTEQDGDIIVPRLLCTLCQQTGYQPILYRSPLGKPIIYPSEANMEKMMNFTKAVMQDIGYRIDGTEWIDAVNFGDRAEITIHQKVNGGWILPIPGARFSFMTDWTWIELARWYDNESISNFEFGLGSDEAEKIAEKFMNNEVNDNSGLEKYQYELSMVGDARIEIIDDKVMYLVGTGYKATNPSYYDAEGHCGQPAYGNFDVLVDASTGIPFGWRFAMCE